MAAEDLPSLEPLDPAGEIPYADLARARRECPVARTSSGTYYLTRRADVLEALKDVDSFVASFRDPGVVVPEEEKLVSEMSEPRHEQVRRIITAAISAQRVGRMEAFVREACVELLGPVVARGGGELIREAIAPLPIIVISRFIGVPTEDHERFKRWNDEVMTGTYPTRNRTERGEGLAGGHPEFAAYLDARIAENRAAAEPPDSLLSKLVRTEVDGRRLTNVEIRTQMFFLVISGNETTRHLIANVVHRVAADPALLERLRADRSLIPALVEESLRLESPIHMLLRNCTRDRTIGGEHIPAGAKLAFGLASANRDESFYDDPDALRLDRANPRDHLAFGAGPHVCPGLALARLEARVVLESLCDLVGSMSLEAGYIRRKVPVFWANGPVELPVRMTAR